MDAYTQANIKFVLLKGHLPGLKLTLKNLIEIYEIPIQTFVLEIKKISNKTELLHS